MSVQTWRIYGNHAQITAGTDACGDAKLCPCLRRDIEQLTAIAEAADRVVRQVDLLGEPDRLTIGRLRFALDQLGRRPRLVDPRDTGSGAP